MFLQKYYNDLQTFVFNNNLLSTSSGFVFGMVSKDFIDKLLNQIILPIILGIFSYHKFENKLNKNYPSLVMIIKFFWLSFIWIISIFISFFVLEYILYRNILGLSSTVIIDDKKKQYIDMKVEAKTSGIVPNDEELYEINIENKIIEKKVQEKIT